MEAERSADQALQDAEEDPSAGETPAALREVHLHRGVASDGESGQAEGHSRGRIQREGEEEQQAEKGDVLADEDLPATQGQQAVAGHAGAAFERKEALRVGADRDGGEQREDQECAGIGLREQAPHGSGDRDHEGEVGIEKGEHLAQVGGDESADAAGDARDDAGDAPGRSAGERRDGVDADGDAKKERGEPRAGTHREQHHGQPEDRAERQAGEPQGDALCGGQRPEREAGSRDFIQRVAGNGEEQEDAEQQEKGIGADGFDAAP